MTDHKPAKPNQGKKKHQNRRSRITNADRLLKWLKNHQKKGMTYLQIINNSGWKVNYLSDLIQQLIHEGWNIRKEREEAYSPTRGGARYQTRVYLRKPERGVPLVVKTRELYQLLVHLQHSPQTIKYLADNPAFLKELGDKL